MIEFISRRIRDREEGFTLIELMVVVLIIAILIAIAIPTFLGARTRAQDRAAQSSLRNAVTNAKTVYTDNQDYTQATVAALTTAEPSLSFKDKDTASAKFTEVSVNPASSSTWFGAALSASGTCFFIADNVGTATAKVPLGTNFAKIASGAANCTGTYAGATPTFSATGW
jgi:type IV pilus assembly protein PilA